MMSSPKAFQPVSSNDDLRISPIQTPKRNSVSPERRRNTSPISNKYEDSDMKSLSSSNISTNHLKKLSRSPASKKLHVTSINENSKYIIPVPFTLNLPPKLGQSPPRILSNKSSASIGSHDRRETSGTLVFTPNGYTKLDSLSDDEDFIIDEDTALNYNLMSEANGIYSESMIPDSPCPNQSSFPMYEQKGDIQAYDPHFSLPPRPMSFPVSSNINKFQMTNRFKELDELSIIEEVSTASRVSSALTTKIMHPKLDKSLPPTPKIPSQEFKSPLIEQLNKPAKFTVVQKTTLPKLPTERPKSLAMTQAQSMSLSKNHHVRTLSDKSLLSSIGTMSTRGDFLTSRMDTKTPPLSLNLKQSSPNTRSPISSIPTSWDRKSPVITQEYNRGKVLKIDPATNAKECKIKQPNAKQSSPESTRNDNEIRNNQVNSNTIDVNELSMNSRLNASTILKVKPDFLKPPNTFGSTRNISESSTGSCDSEMSTESCNSIQESVDIKVSPNRVKYISSRVSRSHENPSNLLRRLIQTVQENVKDEKEILDGDDDDSWEDISKSSLSDDSVIEPLRISRKLTKENIVVDLPEEVENVGAGKEFQFPNSSLKVTNEQPVKRNEIKEKNRYSFYSSDGQIEIPDLSDQKVMDQYSSCAPSSYNGTTFSDIGTVSSHSEPLSGAGTFDTLNVPGKEAMKHFSRQFGVLGLDDDSDSSVLFTTNLTERYDRRKTLGDGKLITTSRDPDNEGGSRSQSGPCPPSNGSEANTSKTQQHVPTQNSTQQDSSSAPIRRGSPVRHGRNKSLCHIDFNPDDAQPTHVRAKSLGEQLKVSTAPLNIKHRSSGSEGILNLNIAEPPALVNYAVDFQESKEQECGPDLPGVAMHDKLILKMIKEIQQRQSKPTTTPQDADTESIVIDLTTEKYDLYYVNRNDSVHTYKSVTEKLDDGKEVEVVLVDDDEEDDVTLQYDEMHNKSTNGQSMAGGEDNDKTSSESDDENKNTISETEDEDDELLSIISKYNNDWGLRNPSSSSCTTLGSNPEVASATKVDYRQPQRVQLKEWSSSSERALLQISKHRPKPSISSTSSSVTYVSHRIKVPGSPLKHQAAFFNENSPTKEKYGVSLMLVPKLLSPMDAVEDANRTIEEVNHPIVDETKESAIKETDDKLECDLPVSQPYRDRRSFTEFPKDKVKIHQRKSVPAFDSNYFDYRTSENYDFHTFMNQRILTGP